MKKITALAALCFFGPLMAMHKDEIANTTTVYQRHHAQSPRGKLKISYTPESKNKPRPEGNTDIDCGEITCLSCMPVCVGAFMYWVTGCPGGC